MAWKRARTGGAVSGLVFVFGAHADTSLVPPVIGRDDGRARRRDAALIVLCAAYLRLTATAS
jgi:hypothetical protein